MQALLGEVAVLQGVAGAVEANNQTVTDKHVIAYPFELDDVLDPR